MTYEELTRLGPPCPRCGRQELGDFGVASLCSACSWNDFHERYRQKRWEEKMVEAQERYELEKE